MPSTGSDTRMYAPRSESNLGWSKDDDDYDYGIGDPEQAEQLRDKKQAEKEERTDTTDLPHLQFSIPEPEPEMPPMMPGMEEEEEEEANPMADQYQEGNQLSAMTGMPDMGNLSIGNATGTMPQPGGTLMTGEPMEHAWSSLLKEEGEEEEEDDAVPDPKRNFKLTPEDEIAAYTERAKRMKEQGTLPVDNALANLNAVRTKEGGEFDAPFNDKTGFTMSEPMDDAWSSLMKARLDQVHGKESEPWKQPLYETPAGGSQQETANTRRAKLQSRYVMPSKKHGIDRAPLSVHRTHLGIATKQPMRLFPQKYGQQMGSMSRRKWQGNIPSTPAGHAMGPETTYSPKAPKAAAMAGLPISEPREPSMRGAAFAKSDNLESLRKDLDEVSKKMSEYMHFAQIRRLLTRLKDVAERQESRLKSTAASGGPGKKGEAGHMEGQNKTTRPTGATETLEDLPESWGAPSTLFAAPGSGRVG